MNALKKALVFTFWVISSHTVAQVEQQAYSPVKQVDFERFAGTWYEIASKPSFGQRDCVATESIYTPLEDGKLALENRCRKKTFDGKWKNLTGKVWPKQDSEFDGALTLQVWWPFKSELWILDVDADYQTAIIGTPNLSTVWLLSKTSNISDESYQQAMQQITDMGFDVDRLQRTPQPL